MKGKKLRYSGPADGWNQGLPLGNGRLGAVVRGRPDGEIWHMTEITYWSGRAEDVPATANAKEELARTRRLFYENDYGGGTKAAQRTLQPAKGNFGTHLSLCDVIVGFADGESAEISRELDLEEAVVRHAIGPRGAKGDREILASHPDGVVVARFRASANAKLIFSIGVQGRTPRFESSATEDGELRFAGQATETMHSDGNCGVNAQGVLKVVATGGSVTAEEGRLFVRGADEALVVFSATTDYGQEGTAWSDRGRTLANDAAAKGFERIKADHVADYRKLYARVDLELGAASADADGLPTDERIRRLREGEGEDPALYALFYQYGRYLMISGSREDSPLPMNLQGTWNDGEANRMAWSCDYHLDVNTEMNYYPAESGNLGECQAPLSRFLEALSVPGRQAARGFYGCEGWVAHVFTNAWGFASPGWETSWGLNVTGGLWLAMQLRERYEFGLDENYLRETAYPVLKEAALFFLDYLTVDPRNGWLVSGPSNSPENSFYPGDPKDGEYQLSMGATMDLELVRELFVFCEKAAGRLNDDAGFRERLARALALLPPLLVGKQGQLQEWLEDYAEAQPDHRHLSHLYSLYPGDRITPRGTPELAAAARKTLELRTARADMEDVEFTLAQLAASYARLGDGERAHRQLTYLVSRLSFDNLLTYSKPGIAGAEANIFVVDGNFGGTAAIAEMLLQSHAGEIELLPALPAGWSEGRASGLRAKGNAEVDLVWKEGRLAEATIRAFSEGETVVRNGEATVSIRLRPGIVYVIDAELGVRQGR